MDGMIKFRGFIVFLLLCVLFTPAFTPASAQESGDTDAGGDMPKFGLQADIFRTVRGINTDFTSNFTNMVEYQLTPGDLFKLIVTSGVKSDGSISNIQEYEIQLQSNYQLNLPFLGTINAKGYKLSELQQYVVQGIRNIIPAQYINFVLITPAQFNIFIYGGVIQPGYLQANPLMGVIEAIAGAGGFKPGGSYRNVRLFRENVEDPISVDISKFYQNADFRANPSLEPGDKVYVPPADIIANISGNIVFPGYYELVPEETTGDLISLAGGVKPDTLTSKIEIVRIQKNGQQTIISLPLSKADEFPLQNGDNVVIHSTTEISEMITIEGAVLGSAGAKTGPISVPQKPLRIDLPYRPGISLLSVLDSVGGPSPLISLDEQGVLKRKNADGTTEKIPLNIQELWKTREARYNTDLKPGDLILVPMKKMQIFVTGYVNDPGAYTFMEGSTVYDYLLLAGGVTENKGDPNGIFLIDENKKRTAVETTDPVSPGDHIYISQKFLFQSDQFIQNLLITTGWVTAIIAVVNTVWDFIDRVRAAP
jgi:polysaccharide biosynthesis/export protein